MTPDAIPEAFWPLLEQRAHQLAAAYQPVTVTRLYPFFVSWIPAKLVEHALMRAVERGIFAINVLNVPRGGDQEPERVRVLALGDKPRFRVKAFGVPA